MPDSTQFVQIGEGNAWSFINGAWTDGPDHALVVPEAILRQDETGIQGHHYAFLRENARGDMVARFQLQLAPHSDAGIILRATHPQQFYVLHFPNCGQASRAQHFWAALSRMDESGYLRIVKLELVRRVASTSSDWLDVEVSLSGKKVSARIGKTGLFEAEAENCPSTGRVGVYLFGKAGLRRLSIEGAEQPAAPWHEEAVPPKNWFHPCPDTEHGLWQRPGQLVRTPGGDLLLNYNVRERPYQGTITPLLTRSTDNGRSWSKPQTVGGLKLGDWEGWGVLHVFPDGKLRMLIPGEESYRLAESPDDGRSWSAGAPISVAPPPANVERLHLGPQVFINLGDGGVVMLAYGRHGSTVAESAIHTWGSHHCQAYACRSTDNGRTWSEWVNVDGTRDAADSLVEGNLDLTEVCGVQTADGRLIAMIRPIYSPWMWETGSADGGASWTPCVRGPFPGYATPNMLRTAAGAILVAHRLPGCTIHTSLDEGITWDQGTMIDSAIWVMGSMLEVEPNLVLYVSMIPLSH